MFSLRFDDYNQYTGSAWHVKFCMDLDYKHTVLTKSSSLPKQCILLVNSTSDSVKYTVLVISASDSVKGGLRCL